MKAIDYSLLKLNDDSVVYVNWLIDVSSYDSLLQYIHSDKGDDVILPLAVSEKILEQQLCNLESIKEYIKKLHILQMEIITGSSKPFSKSVTVEDIEQFRSSIGYSPTTYYNLLYEFLSGDDSSLKGYTSVSPSACTFKVIQSNQNAFDVLFCELECSAQVGGRSGVDWAVEIDRFSKMRRQELFDARAKNELLKQECNELDVLLYKLTSKDQAMEELYVRAFQKLLNSKKTLQETSAVQYNAV